MTKVMSAMDIHRSVLVAGCRSMESPRARPTLRVGAYMAVQVIHTTVFASAPEGGNSCPVALGADELSPQEMQAMAA